MGVIIRHRALKFPQINSRRMYAFLHRPLFLCEISKFSAGRLHRVSNSCNEICNSHQRQSLKLDISQLLTKNERYEIAACSRQSLYDTISDHGNGRFRVDGTDLYQFSSGLSFLLTGRPARAYHTT